MEVEVEVVEEEAEVVSWESATEEAGMAEEEEEEEEVEAFEDLAVEEVGMVEGSEGSGALEEDEDEDGMVELGPGFSATEEDGTVELESPGVSATEGMVESPEPPPLSQLKSLAKLVP